MIQQGPHGGGQPAADMTLPPWAARGQIRFARWDGGALETVKGPLSGWYYMPHPQSIEFTTNWYADGRGIELLLAAGINCIWVTFSNGFSLATELPQQRQLDVSFLMDVTGRNYSRGVVSAQLAAVFARICPCRGRRVNSRSGHFLWRIFMSSLSDLVSEETVLSLAIPSNVRLGRRIFARGGVEITALTPLLVTARVIGEQTRKVELRATPDGLRWACTCRKKQSYDFCKHCVAAAFETMKIAPASMLD
jgi:hypothetical protein